MQQLHPTGDYCIGQDSGIYWRMIDLPERGAEALDWFYVPNVPATLDGQPRRSYVLWQGQYQNLNLPWLRWWDSQGKLLLTGEERANRLANKLRELGVDPDRV